MTIIECKKCGKKFAYEITGMVSPGCKEKEMADCPYCGETAFWEMTSQSIFVYKIDENGAVLYKTRS